MPKVQQKINNQWKTIQSPLTAQLAIDELVMLTAANAGTEFRIDNMRTPLDVLHLDAKVRYNAHAETFYVLCSCNSVFLGGDPGEAESLHGEHVDAVMQKDDSELFHVQPALKLRSARRAAQSIGIDFASWTGESNTSDVTGALIDMMHLLTIMAEGDEYSSGQLLVQAINIFNSEEGIN